MKRRQGKFPLLGILIAFCLLLASCGSAVEQAGADLAPVTLRLITWGSGSQSEKRLIQHFQEENPQIDFEHLPTSYSTEVDINSAPPPDLVNLDAGWQLTQLARSGKVADLTELWIESGLTENVAAGIQEASAFQDQQFYIPISMGWKAIYYNKQIFADYNLTPPETWEDFLTICDTLLANGEVPLAISAVDGWTLYSWFAYLNLRMNGAQFYGDLLAGKERYDDPRVHEVMERWQNLFADGYFIDQRTISEGASMTAIIRRETGRMQGEKAAMVLASTYAYGNMPAPFQAEVDFFRFPIMDSSLPMAEVVDSLGYVLPLGAEHFQPTLIFLKYLSSPEAQLLAAQTPMLASALYAPARSDVNSEALSANQRQGFTLINEADETVLSFEYALPQPMRALVESAFKAFVRNPEDIETTIVQLEEARQRMVDQGFLLTE